MYKISKLQRCIRHAAQGRWICLQCRRKKQSEDSQSCLTLCDPMDCSPPGSSVHGIFQAIVLERIAISFSRGSSRPRDQTLVSCIVDRRFTIWATSDTRGKSQNLLLLEFLYLMETPLNEYQQDGSSSASFLGCPSTHKKLKLSLDGSGVWWRMDPCICVAESLHCSSETITTSLISYTPMQNDFGIKENKNYV